VYLQYFIHRHGNLIPSSNDSESWFDFFIRLIVCCQLDQELCDQQHGVSPVGIKLVFSLSFSIFCFLFLGFPHNNLLNVTYNSFSFMFALIRLVIVNHFVPNTFNSAFFGSCHAECPKPVFVFRSLFRNIVSWQIKTQPVLLVYTLYTFVNLLVYL